MLTSIQSAGVAQEVNLRNSMEARKHARDPSWLWNPGQTSPEVQNRGISETQGRRHQKSKTGVSVKPRTDVTRSPKQGYQWNSGQTSLDVTSVAPQKGWFCQIRLAHPIGLKLLFILKKKPECVDSDGQSDSQTVIIIIATMINLDGDGHCDCDGVGMCKQIFKVNPHQSKWK